MRPAAQPRCLQQEQREQRMALGKAADHTGDHAGQADSFFAQIGAQRGVALVENQIQDRQDGIEPSGKFAFFRHLKPQVANLALAAHQTLRDGRFLRQESAGNLRYTEAGHGLQCQSDLRLGRKLRMTAQKNQRELVVSQRVLGRLARGQIETAPQLSFFLRQPRFAPDAIDRPVLGNLNQPGGWIARNSGKRPRFERLEQRVLHHLLRQVQVPGAENADQRGDHPPRLVAEQMVYDLVRALTHSTSRISMLPNSRCGQLYARSTTASYDTAVSMKKPPRTSLLSVNGPSVTTYLPALFRSTRPSPFFNLLPCACTDSRQSR